MTTTASQLVAEFKSAYVPPPNIGFRISTEYRVVIDIPDKVFFAILDANGVEQPCVFNTDEFHALLKPSWDFMQRTCMDWEPQSVNYAESYADMAVFDNVNDAVRWATMHRAVYTAALAEIDRLYHAIDSKHGQYRVLTLK